MAITYSEFDTTPAGLVAALKAAILASSDWSADAAITPATTTTTGATSASGTTVTVTSTTGLSVGQSITIGTIGSGTETHRVITGITGSTLTVTPTWGVIYASGSALRTRNNIVRTTTTSGAKIVLDLEGASSDNYLSYLGVGIYREYAGTAPSGFTDPTQAYCYYRATAGTSTMPLHVVLSAGKDHLFFSIEGPRASEASPTSTTYGSVKNYVAISELTPYHAADTTPAVVVAGYAFPLLLPSVSSGAHQSAASRNWNNTASWGAGRLATLDWPTIFTTDVVTMPRDCDIDGNTYLLPYVYFSEADGIRGRLKNIFYAGTTAPSAVTDLPEPVGSKVSYNGITYKLIAPNKGDGSNVAWGPFGSVSNGSSTPMRSIVIAVPFATE
jgi:hypothetical protein